MSSKYACLVALAIASCAAAVGPGPAEGSAEVALQFPHAGVALRIPAGFIARQVRSEFTVAEAVLTEDGQGVVSITLSAWAASAEQTPEEFSQAAFTELKGDLAVRNLEILKTTPMEVAGLPGVAERMSYAYRGRDTVAARVYFLRPLKQENRQIAYVLTVEVLSRCRERLLPVLSGVVKSISLIPVRRPCAVGVGQLGEPIVDEKLGYSMRPPRSWYARRSEVGVSMGQVDYLGGGVQGPTAQIVVARVPGEMTSDVCVDKCIAMCREQAKSEKLSVEVASRGPATLGGVVGCQFVLTEEPAIPATAPQDAQSPPAIVKVHRIVSLPVGADGKRTVYTLILACGGVDVKAAEALAEQLAGGFEFLPGVVLPTTAPAEPTSQPAQATITAEK